MADLNDDKIEGVRLDKDKIDKLQKLTEVLKKNKSDVMREALDHLYKKYEPVIEELNKLDNNIKQREDEIDTYKKRREEIISSVE